MIILYVALTNFTEVKIQRCKKNRIFMQINCVAAIKKYRTNNKNVSFL